MSSWIKIVVSVNVSPNYILIIFLLLIASSLSCNFHRWAVCFQSFMNIAWRSTQNAALIRLFLRLYFVIKPLNGTKINVINSLLCWSVTLLMFIQTLYYTVSLKVHDGSSWILTECNLSWKIVKYCSLSEVCMINCTVSPQIWRIKSINGICWQDFVK